MTNRKNNTGLIDKNFFPLNTKHPRGLNYTNVDFHWLFNKTENGVWMNIYHVDAKNPAVGWYKGSPRGRGDCSQ